MNKNPKLLFGFGLDRNNSTIKCKAAQALLRLYWRVIYKHMTRISTEALSRWYVFHKLQTVMCDDLARTLMAKILTYQLNLREHYRRKLNTPLEEKLPSSAVELISPIGDLDARSGKLVIKPKLVDFFQRHHCWTDFNTS